MKTDKNRQVLIRDAEPADVYRLAPRLRESDRAEVWASHHFTAEEALRTSFFSSDYCFSAVYDSKVIAMWGVAKLQGKPGGMVWFLGADEVADYPVRMFRMGRKFVRQALVLYGYLENYVDVRNTLSVAWLRWLGFTFDQAAPYGIEGRLFYHFYSKIPSVGIMGGGSQDVCSGSSRSG